jgi:hypothetical protein
VEIKVKLNIIEYNFMTLITLIKDNTLLYNYNNKEVNIYKVLIKVYN